jgi:ATP-binding cassette subfamily G (WHITE) protein 2 (SNQ2)
MKPWFSWIRWINPIYYSFEALIINELDGLAIDCSPPQLFPLATGGPQGCAITGAQPGETQLMGQAWGNQALEFYKVHVWRNFGIVVALWIFCLALCTIVIERLPAAGSNKAVLLYKRGGGGKFIRAANQNGNGPKDEEEGSNQAQVNEKQNGKSGSGDEAGQVHADNTSVVPCAPLDLS